MKKNLKKIFLGLTLTLSASSAGYLGKNSVYAKAVEPKQCNCFLCKNRQNGIWNEADESKKAKQTETNLMAFEKNSLPPNRLVILTYIPEVEKFSFGIPIEDGNVFAKYDETKILKVKAVDRKTNNQVEATASVVDLGSKEPLKEFVFEMDSKELANGIYDFQVYDGDELIYTFADEKIQKEEHGIWNEADETNEFEINVEKTAPIVLSKSKKVNSKKRRRKKKGVSRKFAKAHSMTKSRKNTGMSKKHVGANLNKRHRNTHVNYDANLKKAL